MLHVQHFDLQHARAYITHAAQRQWAEPMCMLIFGNYATGEATWPDNQSKLKMAAGLTQWQHTSLLCENNVPSCYLPFTRKTLPWMPLLLLSLLMLLGCCYRCCCCCR
jgi:hypothetical protein